MLYDILSPLVFLGSLGGIILVVSRIGLRVRREQIEYVIKRETSTTVNPDQILRPNQKSVQAFKSRIGLMKQTATQTVANTKNSWRAYKEKRQA